MIGIVDTLIRSIERPSVPLSQAGDELYDALGARRSDAGVVVNRVTALRHPAIWRGVNLLSRDTAKLPLLIYRRVGEGKTRAIEHPAYKLLKDAPNGQMTAFTFVQTITAHAILNGNGYALITRRGDGRPVELLPLLPDRTYPVRVNGRLMYVTAIGGDLEDVASEVRTLAANDVIHIKGLGYNGLCGYSLIEYGVDAIGHGMALEKYGSRFFKNSARPSVLIEHPGQISEPAAKRLRESWDKLYAGVENAHRTAILEEGMKATPMTINAKDSQLLESQEFDLTKIANLLGLPPHKVGGKGRTAYASLEQENQAYLDEGLDPWLVAWEQECRTKLLTEDEKRTDSHVVEFLRQALERADLATRTAAYVSGLNNSYLNPDEVRARENLNPIPEGEGQKFFRPMNMTVIGDDDEAVVSTPDQTQLAAAIAAIVAQVSAGTMPHESAKGILKAAFPALTDAQINAIIDPIEVAPPPEPEPEMSTVVDKPEGEEPPETEEEPEDEDRAAHKALMVHTLSRAIRRIGEKARRAAVQSKRFEEWLGGFEAKHSPAVVEIIDAPLAVCRKDASAGDVAAQLFAEVRRVLDDCYSTMPEKEFVAGVDERMTACETAFAEQLAEEILNRSK